MAFDGYLGAAGFTGASLFGQYPRFEATGSPTRFAITNGKEDAIVQLWPSGRPGAWFVGVLNLFKSTLDYGIVPRENGGIIEIANRYLLDVADWTIWKQAVNFVFAYHPWVDLDNPDDDVGVPGILQFLTQFPFAEKIIVEGQSSTAVIIPKKITWSAPASAEDKHDKQLRMVEI